MALPGVIDPLTGTAAPNPLDPTNPASGLSAVPAPIDLSAGVGLTGADAYNVQRLTRAQTYLSGATNSYADISTAAALAPTDWQTLDQHIQALGGQPGYGAGVGQLLDHLTQSGTQKVSVADIGSLQQTMIKQGYLPPGTPVTGVWDANSAAAFKAMEDASYNKAASGQKAGGASPLQLLSWLNDFLPSQVSQALAGTAKFLFGGIAHTVSRQAIEAVHAPGSFLGQFVPVPGMEDPSKKIAQNPEVQAALKAHGLLGGAAGATEDLATVLSLLPILKGAGVLQQGVKGALAQGAEQGFTTAAEGAVSKGIIATGLRATLANAASDPVAVGDLLNSYATRTFSRQALGEAFLNTADQLAAVKSTAIGQLVTTGLNAATQTAIGERAAANISSGTYLPNVKLGKEERSTLGQAIDNSPALGQSWRIPGASYLGNPLDLSAFIWAPTEALPIGGQPGLGDMANSLERITPTHDTMPITRLTGLSRQALVDAAGEDAYLNQGMRYWQLQASVNSEAAGYVKNTLHIGTSDPGFAEAMSAKAQEIQGRLKADPLAMEKAISDVQPVDVMHQFSYMFKDNPELLARRGQGAPVLSDWFAANNALRGTTAGPQGVLTAVTDEAGVPLKVFHGTTAAFQDFSLKSSSFYKGEGGAIHFTEDPEWASVHAMGPFESPKLSSIEGANIHAAYLDIRNPYPATDAELAGEFFTPAKVAELKLQGYDGVVYSEGEPAAKSYAVFEPSQIHRTPGTLPGGVGATVEPFTRGSGMWAQANQDDLNAALEPFFADKSIPPIRDAEGNLVTPQRPGGGSVPASSYAFGETMAGRLGQALAPDAAIALRRADNALGSAQQLGAWKTLNDRLGGVVESLTQRIGEAGPGDTVELPKRIQTGDITAAGVQPTLNPRDLGLTGATLSGQDAQRLLSNLTDRVGDLRDGMAKYYPETAQMDPKALSTYAGKLFLSAPRDVTLADDVLHADLLNKGYQPIALHPNAITLNDVGAGTADGLANAGQVSPVIDHLGLKGARPTDPEIQFMKMQSLKNELTQVGAEHGLGTGEEVLGRIRDGAREAHDAQTKINLPLGKRNFMLYGGREIADLRQMTPGMLQRFSGFSPEEAWDVYGAVRRGAAFGFDISRPIATGRALMEGLGYSGLPGIEDAIRTAVGARDRLPDFIQGPAGHILNLPDWGVKVRDFLQFTMSPYFSAARAFKTKILRGVSGEDLPFDFRPKARIADMADESGDATGFLQRFTDNFSKVAGPRGDAYATLLDHADFGVRNPGSGVFGWTNTDGEALDAWHMSQRIRAENNIPADVDLSASQYRYIKGKLDKVYRYGGRGPVQKSLNYIFFPLSFNLKVGSALGGWMLQNPARILVANMGLQAFNQLNGPDNKVGGFVDRYMPLLTEANKLNFFAHGFGTQLSPIGGRNMMIWNAAKDAVAVIRNDPRLGAFVPIGASDENLPNMLGMMGNLIPMWRQMQTLGPALDQQIRVGATEAQKAVATTGLTTAPLSAAGAEQWQVDNYYQTMNDLKRQVAIALGNAGMKPSFSTLTDTYGNPNAKIRPEFFNQVQAAIGQVEAKYPAGAAFAKAQSADYQTRADALNEMLRKPVKTRADASMLYFAAAYYDLQAQAQSSARANAAQSRAGRALYQQIAGAMAQGTTPPTLPGDLDAEQVAQLRRLALGLSQQAGPDFDRHYNSLFKSELGPLTAIDQAPGTAA